MTTRSCCRAPTRSYNTRCTTPAGYHTYTEFGLLPVRSPLLRELFLFFGVLRCFSSPTCLTLSLQRGVPAHHGGGLPHSEISGSACQRLPGAFRSVTTSFFGPGCQGIHHMPLFACDTPPSAPLLHSLCPSGNVARIRIAEESVHEHFLTRIVVVTHLTLDRCLVRNWFPTASTSPPQGLPEGNTQKHSLVTRCLVFSW